MPIESALQQELRKIRQALELCWAKETSHASYEGRQGSPVGQCFVSTLVMFDLLKQYKPLIVSGTIADTSNRHLSHYWLEINEKIVDLTADQFFNLQLPPIVFAPYNKMPQYEPCKRRTSIKSYKYSPAYYRYELLLGYMKNGN